MNNKTISIKLSEMDIEIILRIIFICIIVFYSFCISNHLIKPKLITCSPSAIDYYNVQPNQEHYFTCPVAVRPIYGSDMAVPIIGIKNYKTNITSHIYVSLDNKTFDMELGPLHSTPLISNIVWLYDPNSEYDGMKEMTLIKGINEPNKTINFYFKAVTSPNIIQYAKSVNKTRISPGEILISFKNPFGILEYPLYIILLISIFTFLLNVFKYFSEKNKYIAMIIISIIFSIFIRVITTM